jgi:hypothetical protein
LCRGSRRRVVYYPVAGSAATAGSSLEVDPSDVRGALPMTYEEEILAKHSTPGLRKHELTRLAKKDHLGSMNIKGPEAEKILNEMYPRDVSNGITTRPIDC